MPATRVRRECCCSRHSTPTQATSSKADEKKSKGILDIKLRSTSTIARLHATAARLVAKPTRSANNSSADSPVVENMRAGSRQEGVNWDPSPDTRGHIPQRVSAGVGVGVEDGADSCPSSSCSHADEVEQRRTINSNGNSGPAATLDIIRSPSKGGGCNTRGCASNGGSTDGICSGDENVGKNDETMGEPSDQVPSECSSSDSDDWLFTEESAEPPLRPAGLHDDNRKHEARDNESPPNAIAVEEGGQTLLKREAPRRHFRHRGSRRRRRGSTKRGGAKAEPVGRGSVDRNESWSNRSLTVLFKELGLHQSCQRAVLSKHMPVAFKGDEDGELQLKPPPLHRIDRPHFRPTFVELAAAGKGSTVRPSTTTPYCVETLENNSINAIYLKKLDRHSRVSKVLLLFGQRLQQ